MPSFRESNPVVTGIATAVVLIVLVFLGSSLGEEIAGKQKQKLCLSAPITTAMGGVEYPVAPKYARLRGLGMLLTAEDCGMARFAEVSQKLDYRQVGGLLRLDAAPSPELHAALTALGFVCDSLFTTDCTTWRLKSETTSPADLLQLRPFFDQCSIGDETGNCASEDCASCG